MKKLLFWVFTFAFIQTNIQAGNGFSANMNKLAILSADSIPSVTIGTQVWTSKNLDVATYRNGDLIPEVTDANAWGNLTTGAWCWYNNDSATYAATCGKLYNWYALNDPRGLVPAGYHVPSNAEWTLLSDYLSPDPGLKLKSTTGWDPGYDDFTGPIVNTNSSGFSAIASGVRIDGYFSYLGMIGDWWSTDESLVNIGFISDYYLYKDNNMLSYSNHEKFAGLSVRLIKDAITCTPNTGDTTASVNNSFEWYGNTYTTSATPTHTFTNVGGCDSVVTLHLTILYPDVTIGTQIWTSKNLDVATYRNGEPIPQITDANAWGSLTTGAWCWYNNDSATYAATYGRLYNWYAVNDLRGLAPTGYHVPSDAEWTTLSDYLGPNAAIAMRATTGWESAFDMMTDQPIVNTNSSGFTAFPGGCRNSEGTFSYIGRRTGWWSTGESLINAGYTNQYVFFNFEVQLKYSNDQKSSGYSVRLIKDAITCTPNTGDTSATACNSFEWYGTTYTASATPTHTFTNVAGCDSVVTLHLTISNINVSFSGDTLLFTIADCGETITDFHTSISNDILTITAANASNSIALAADMPFGITSDNASYVAIDFASIQNFSGIKILGGSGTDIVTIGANGVDLSTIGYGNNNQSFTALLNSANDSLIVGNAIKTKGFGNIYLQSVKGLSLNAPLTASLDSISLISNGNVYQTAAVSSKYLSLGYGVRLTDVCSSSDISNSGNYILTNAENAIDTLIACTNGTVSYNDIDNVIETFARIRGNFTLTGGGDLKIAACGIVSTSAQSNINISSTGGSVAVENNGIKTNGDVTLNSTTSAISNNGNGIVSNGKVTITASGNVSSNAFGIDNNSGNGIAINSTNGTVNISDNGIKSKDTIVVTAYGDITICGNGINNTAGTGKKLSVISTTGSLNSGCSGISSKGKVTIQTYGNVFTGGNGIQNGTGLGVDVTSTNGTVTVTDGGLTSNGVVNLLAVGNVIARSINSYNASNINITSTGGSVSTGYGGVQTQGKITILSYGDINTTDGGISNSNGTGIDFTSVNGGIAIRGGGLSSSGNVNFIASGDILTTDGGTNLYGAGGKLTISSTSGTATISGSGTQSRGDIEIKAKRNVTIIGGGLRNDNSTNGSISFQSDSAAVVVSNNSSVTSKNNIIVKANDLSLSSQNALKTVGKKISIFPVSANTAINLGGISTTGVLGISNAFLDYMTADTIAIGDDANATSILVSTKITDTIHSIVFAANLTGSITLTDSLRLKDVDVSAIHKYKTNITSTSTSNVLNVSGAVILGTNTLFELTSSVTGFANGNTITLVNNENSDAVSGNFVGLSEGDTLSFLDGIGSRVPYQISYAGGDGNDVVLTVFGLCTPNSGDTTAIACNSFEWYGTTYTASATPTHTFTNVAGCDSVVTLHLTINTSTTSTTIIAICNTEAPYSWNGSSYSQSGTYSYTTTNAANCDSVATLVLTIRAAIANPVGQVLQPTCSTATGTIEFLEFGLGLTYSIGGAYMDLPFFNNVVPGTYTLSVRNGEGCTSAETATVTVNPQPITPIVPTITGLVNVCYLIGNGNVSTYTATATGATGYNWILPPNTTLISGQGSSTITVSFLSGFLSQANKQLRVNAVSSCGTSAYKIYYLAAQLPVTPSAIVASTANVCPSISTNVPITYRIPKVSGAASYIWTAQANSTTINHPNGLGENDTLVTVTFNSTFTSSVISVQSVNDCGTSTTRSLTITKSNPSTPSLISGPSNSCAYIGDAGNTATYSVINSTVVETYDWTIPANATNITGQGNNSISFKFPAGFISGNVSVTATNGCGISASRVLSINRLLPVTPGSIDVINTSVCPNREYTYSIASMPGNATSVEWSIPIGGTLISGQGTTSIAVSYAAGVIDGKVLARSINNCGVSSYKSTIVKLASCPSAPSTQYAKGLQLSSMETLEINVFPNPTTSSFNVNASTNGSSDIINASLFDLQGRLIQTMKMTPDENVSLGAPLKPGVYFLELNQGKEKKVVRVVKY